MYDPPIEHIQHIRPVHSWFAAICLWMGMCLSLGGSKHKHGLNGVAYISESFDWNVNLNSFMTYLLPNKNVQELGEDELNILANSIRWHNSHYLGYCRHYLYPYIAFPTDLKLDAHIFHTPTEMFNTSYLWPNMTRANYFTGKFKSSWMICSLNVIYHNYTSIIFKNEMVIEVIVSVNDASRWHLAPRGNNAKDATFTNERFLCVFSDGTVVYSMKVTKTYVGMFKIECVISDETELVSKILMQDERNRIENNFISTIGLTIFPLKRHSSMQVLIKQFEIAKRVQLPVCTQIVVNNKPRIYTSEKEYYALPSYQTKSPVSSSNSKKTHVQLHSTVPHPQDKKYFLSIGTLIYPTQAAGQAKSDLLQANLLLQQSIDWYLFQGFDHLYLYNHIYKRPQETISYFYDYLTQHGYMSDYLSSDQIKSGCIYDDCPITLIEWNMHQLPHSQRYFQEVGTQDVVQRFMHQSEYIFINDVDELLVPLQRSDVSLNAREILKKYLKTDDEIANMIYTHVIKNSQRSAYEQLWTTTADLNIDFTAASIKTVPAFQNIHALMYDKSEANANNKQLGCDVKNKVNRFDTFVQRQSCFLYEPVNKKDEGDGSYLDLVDKLRKNDLWIDVDVEKKATNLQKLYNAFDANDPELYDVFPKLIAKSNHYFYVYHHQLWLHRGEMGLNHNIALRKALARIRDSTDLSLEELTTAMEFLSTVTLNYREKSFGLPGKENELVSLHLRDHWAHLFMKEGIDQKNGVDMTALWTMTKNDCPHQDDVLFWNEQFLNSRYGGKYKDKLLVNPLIDKDGIFCSVRIENSSYAVPKWYIPK